MNNLSILIYLGDVIGSLSEILLGVGLVASVLGVFLLLFYLVDKEDHYNTIYTDYRDATLYPYRNLWVFGVAILLLSSLTPSSSTIYAIAASEAGEEFLAPDTGNKAAQALNSWLDDQISRQEENEQ